MLTFQQLPYIYDKSFITAASSSEQKSF